jgi:hypothetical protein
LVDVTGQIQGGAGADRVADPCPGVARGHILSELEDDARASGYAGQHPKPRSTTAVGGNR